MAVQLMLAASLRKYVPRYNAEIGYPVEVEPGTTIRDIARLLSIPEDEVKIMMVDGIAAKWETALSGDERLALFPSIGGG